MKNCRCSAIFVDGLGMEIRKDCEENNGFAKPVKKFGSDLRASPWKNKKTASKES